MNISLKHGFDSSRIHSISPFTPLALIDIAHILDAECHDLYEEDHAEITFDVRFVNSHSTFTLYEFDKLFSASEKYTQVAVNIVCPHVSSSFLVSPSEISVEISSDFITKPQLEKTLAIIVDKIEPYYLSAKRTHVVGDETDELNIMRAKIETLPIVDDAGNFLCERPLSGDSTSKEPYNRSYSDSADSANKKTPFYKTRLFWVEILFSSGFVVWLLDRLL